MVLTSAECPSYPILRDFGWDNEIVVITVIASKMENHLFVDG